MICADTATKMNKHRKAFLRTWRLKYLTLVNGLDEAGDNSSTSPGCRKAI